MTLKLKLGDSLEVLKKCPDNYVDSIVTDPPYGLSFMGKKWDYDVPSAELWKECLRVLKPGGYMLAACGTRTQHRMAASIEDAGFEIRDVISWLYAQGFPKSLNIKKAAIKEGIACGCETKSEHELRPVSDADISQEVSNNKTSGQVLQSSMPKQSTPAYRDTNSSRINEGGEQPFVEGRELSRTGQGVQNDQNASAPTSASERLCTGTYSSSGTDARSTSDGDRSSTPPKPQSVGQSTGKSEGICIPKGALDGTPLPRCSNCQKPIFSEGLGSALKPACEFWTLARKPLSESTLAKNVLKHGTGGLNIDGSRIDSNGEKIEVGRQNRGSKSTFQASEVTGEATEFSDKGRFPANVLFDEDAAKVLDEQSGVSKSQPRRLSATENANIENEILGKTGKRKESEHNDSGGASRFFYVAKASKSDRGEGNTHPTVKPIKLMEYLIKLITPPNGIVLDPFMGSGSTGVAAKRLGFGFVGVELSPEYFEIAKQRIEGVKDGSE